MSWLVLAFISFEDELIIQQLLVIYNRITKELQSCKDAPLRRSSTRRLRMNVNTTEMSRTHSDVSSSNVLIVLMWARASGSLGIIVCLSYRRRRKVAMSG